jgi:two-component system, response regulator PdtaR
MAKNLKISIVEDEAIIAQFLKMELEYEGYIVTGICSNGKDCIEAAKNMDTDVLLMDINLNGAIDGIETAKEILKFKEVAIIFMTGFSEELVKKRALELEPAAFLSKPIEVEDLMPILEKLN